MEYLESNPLGVTSPEVLGTLKTLHKLARLQAKSSGMVAQEVRDTIKLIELYAPANCRYLINMMYDSSYNFK